MNLHEIKATSVAHKTRIRRGRGRGSGKGKTCGRGSNGQRSRSGDKKANLYEGGQMPLFRHLPKRGFNNKIFAHRYTIVNVGALNSFADGQEVDPKVLIESGLIARVLDGVKILGDGELTRALTVKAHHFSKSAAEKIEAAGGSATVLSGGEGKGQDSAE